MKIVLGAIAVLLILVGAAFFIGKGVGNRANDAPTTVQDEAAITQAVLEQLPKPVHDIVVAIGVLVGLNTFGRYFLMWSGVIIQVAMASITIMFMQFLVLIRGNSTEAAHKYAFLASCVVSGLIVIATGILLLAVPGGQKAFSIEMMTLGAIVFLALGGGFSYTWPSLMGEYKSDAQGNVTASTRVKGGSIHIAGRGRNVVVKDDDIKWT